MVGGLISLGIPAAFVSLIKKIGVSHRASGLIDRIHLHETGLITEVDIALTSPWEGHHPYTLSSRWKNDGKLTFYIKQLGDYTRTLGHSLHIGDAVTV